MLERTPAALTAMLRGLPEAWVTADAGEGTWNARNVVGYLIDGEETDCTLAQLLATWVSHDLDHIVQIARTMAGRYRETAGPWTAYLRVLRPQRDA